MSDSNLCDLKITPEKEKKIAQINLVLHETTWFELDNILKNLLETVPKDVILKQEVFENNICFIEIKYETLEGVTKTLEEFITSNEQLKLQKKQIFIKKLGGWFDF